MRKLPIYKLKIKDDNEDVSGVEYVALVDAPAIERTFQVFANQKPFHFKPDSEEKRIASGPLMVADLPIYRRDQEHGEFYVVFDKETIASIVHKYFRKGFTSNVNKMHDPAKAVEGVYMFESFLIDPARGIKTPEGFDELPEGSWFGSFKIDNEEVWSEIKAGTFQGFSVEGMFEPVFEDEQPEDEILQVIDTIQSMLE